MLVVSVRSTEALDDMASLRTVQYEEGRRTTPLRLVERRMEMV